MVLYLKRNLDTMAQTVFDKMKLMILTSISHPTLLQTIILILN
jgi:hypothetical protein